MTPQLSVYLDLMRFSAAVWVLASHMAVWGVSNASWLPGSGRDGVVVFFVLSGFVISYAAERKPRAIDYMIARAARIYSVALPLLLLAVVVDSVAIAYLDPEPYPLYQYQKLWLYIPFHVMFLGEIWFISEQPFSIAPYWSLGYEVWYYLIFAALFFMRGWMRIILTIALLLFVGPKLWLLWPIWMLGVWLYRNMDRLSLDPLAARALCIGSLTVYIGYTLLDLDQVLREGPSLFLFGTYDASPLASAKQFLSDYLVAGLFAANLIGFRYSGWSLPAARPIVWCAGFTFTLYLLHGLVLHFMKSLNVLDPGSLIHTAAAILTVAVLTVLVGYLTERRKAAWEALFRYLVAVGTAPFRGKAEEVAQAVAGSSPRSEVAR
jgi:peptidoglycan/LPS O-acetylase OafA/YrhL